MKAVIDSSAFLAVVLMEPERKWLIHRTSGVEAFAPEILPYEIGNALSAMLKRGRLTIEETQAAFEAFSRMTVRLVPCSISDALELSASRNIYAYDAYFLVSAREIGCTLVTLDQKMRTIANDLGIRSLEPNQ